MIAPPDDTPRDWRWAERPDAAPQNAASNDAAKCGAPDPVTGRAPLMPGAEADDVPALLREADAFCHDWEHATLRLALVADQSLVIRRLQNDIARVSAERDRLARRLRAVGAIAQGARFRLDPDPDADADDRPCGWTSR